MKILLWIGAGLLSIVLLFGIIQTVASERVEVVELHTVDANGGEHTTRLWIVDREGVPYLRGDAESGWLRGDAESGWLQRMIENETLELTRDGNRETYRYTLREDLADEINRLMHEKYTWGDEFFAAVLGGRENAKPVELHPAVGQ